MDMGTYLKVHVLAVNILQALTSLLSNGFRWGPQTACVKVCLLLRNDVSTGTLFMCCSLEKLSAFF